MTDLPSDVAIEAIWLVEATYAPDAAETRWWTTLAGTTRIERPARRARTDQSTSSA